MVEKLYGVYTEKGQLLLIEKSKVCAEFMGLTTAGFRRCIRNQTLSKQGYYASIYCDELEKEITRVAFYKTKKDMLVPRKQKSGLMKLVKIKKGKLYKWDYLINNGYIFLAKEITSKDNIRSYKDVIKLKKDDLEKYFERCKI